VEIVNGKKNVMKIYNTLTRKKEVLKPIKKDSVGLYTCGPTVYNYAHIGNLRTYIFEDILKRVLLYNNYQVKHVMNITDVGHLTSDADEGEDKMDVAVKREKRTPEEIAQFYTNAFKEDLSKLNILEPDIWCKATEHISDMVKLVKMIKKNGYSYIGKSGNVYFDTGKFRNYGNLARLDLESLKAGARTEIDEEKKYPRDFVLWFSTKGSKFKGHILKWDSPWGEGWPGWHLECSAMSMKYLGEHFDIHCGGVDHIPLHHTNEIAQSESATGTKWVNYWLHGEFLIMKKGRMAKSTGGFVTLKTLTENNYNPLAFRYMCLNTHYRKKLNFDFDGLDSAQKALSTLRENIRILKKQNTGKTKKEKIEDYRERFLKAINDDLNMPRALDIIWKLIRDEKNISSKDKYEMLLKFDKVLGLDLGKAEDKLKISKEIRDLINKREEYRKTKKWDQADRIRRQLLNKGIFIIDTPQGTILRKVKPFTGN
jgi:cysteinyl-tRNA synthetase